LPSKRGLLVISRNDAMTRPESSDGWLPAPPMALCTDLRSGAPLHPPRAAARIADPTAERLPSVRGEGGGARKRRRRWNQPRPLYGGLGWRRDRDRLVYEVDGTLTTAWPTCPAPSRSPRPRALTDATFPYVRKLATLGVDAALALDRFATGLIIADGEIIYAPVAEACAQGAPVAAC
jgi:hypothetical protein